MTVPAWPEALPRPEQQTFRATVQDSRVRRRNEAGPPGYRRRFSSVTRPVTLSVALTRDQKAEFDAFFAADCGYGALPFTMPDPTTDGWALLDNEGRPLLTETDEPILLSASWLCAWGDQMPTETIIGLDFRLSFSVWVLP